MTDLPAGWTEVALGALTEPVPKRAPTGGVGESFTYVDLSSVDHSLKQIVTPTDVPVGEAPSRARQVVASGDVLVSTVRPNLNGVAMVPAELDGATASTGFCVLRPNQRTLHERYLFHWVRSPRFIGSMIRLATGASYPAVTDRIVKSSEIPLPPLEEQRRIAAILDKADELRAKRRAAREQLDTLTQAIFLGVRADHPEAPHVTVESVAASERGAIRTGPFGSELLHSEFVDQGVRVLGIDNVVANEFRWAEPRYITHEKYETLRRFTVHPGDVLVTIMGTCGRAAVVPDDVPVAINTKHLCCITPDRAVAEPRWLHAALLYDHETRRQLGERAKGAVMPGLNMGLIKATLVPLPALDVQRKFVARLEALEHVEARASRTHAELDSLFDSLQSRAFRGEL